MNNPLIIKLRRTQRILINVSIALGIAGLGFVIHGLVKYGFDGDANLLGDYLGGTTGSMWAAAGVLVVYLAFLAQRIQLEVQDIELDNTRNSLEKQVFENTFFHSLSLHSSTVKEIDIEVGDKTRKGKDCLRTLFNEFKVEFNINDDPNTIERIKCSFKGLLSKHALDVSTYFNSFGLLVFLLQNKSEIDFEYYSTIILSQMSDYELALVYYYSIVDPKFADFATRNSIFDAFSVNPALDLIGGRSDILNNKPQNSP